jgi:hypothetical protein
MVMVTHKHSGCLGIIAKFASLKMYTVFSLVMAETIILHQVLQMKKEDRKGQNGAVVSGSDV